MKFIADRTLGKLVRKLRMLGLDAVYWSGGNLEGAVKAALAEGRVLLTRSRKIQEKGGGLQFLVIEANDPGEQIRETLLRLGVKPEANKFFSRCLMCNQGLQAIPKEEAEGKVPDFIYRAYDSFHVCPSCRRTYWPGTHLQKMKREMEGTISND
ncbi:MAG: Mut7-C RNAse domain-containing protein [Thermodesulfobacteriota bacterium]|nr:Mut7-C RNAse domain-containing protein [Thermodesulfobacteriota bacterium]